MMSNKQVRQLLFKIMKSAPMEKQTFEIILNALRKLLREERKCLNR